MDSEIFTNIIDGVIGGFIGRFIGGFLRKYLANKSLEWYKNEYKKSLQDYNLYSLKRNEIYAELYKLGQIGYGSLPAFHGRVNVPLGKTEIEKDNRYYENCELKIREFNNYLIINELYLSNKISELSYKLFNKLRELQNMCQARYVKNIQDKGEKSLRENIDECFKSLKQEMKNDIFGE